MMRLRATCSLRTAADFVLARGHGGGGGNCGVVVLDIVVEPGSIARRAHWLDSAWPQDTSVEA